MNPITLFLAAAAGLAGITLFLLVSPWAGAPLVLMAVLITLSPKMANAWQKFVILRAGNLRSSSCAPATFTASRAPACS